MNTQTHPQEEEALLTLLTTTGQGKRSPISSLYSSSFTMGVPCEEDHRRANKDILCAWVEVREVMLFGVRILKKSRYHEILGRDF